MVYAKINPLLCGFLWGRGREEGDPQQHRGNAGRTAGIVDTLFPLFSLADPEGKLPPSAQLYPCTGGTNGFVLSEIIHSKSYPANLGWIVAALVSALIFLPQGGHKRTGIMCASHSKHPQPRTCMSGVGREHRLWLQITRLGGQGNGREKAGCSSASSTASLRGPWTAFHLGCLPLVALVTIPCRQQRGG